jgi:DNA-binding MarR family transcriptional regulator
MSEKNARQLRLDQFLPYRLSFTSNAVSEQIATAYRSLFGLSIPEWRLIAVLAEEKGTTQQRLCARTGMDKVTVSRAAVALARRSLVARVPNPGDGRSRLLSLTSAGEALHAQIVPKAMEMERGIFACLDANERAHLMDYLQRIDQQVVER